MGEPSPELSHVHFELHDYTPPTLHSSSSNAHRSDHAALQDSHTDRILLDFSMDNTSHPSPFFKSSDLNTFDHRPDDECMDSLEFNLALERPPSPFLTRPQAMLQRSDPTMTTPDGEDIREPAFDHVHDTSQHSLQERQSLPSTSQVREFCTWTCSIESTNLAKYLGYFTHCAAGRVKHKEQRTTQSLRLPSSYGWTSTFVQARLFFSLCLRLCVSNQDAII